MIEIVDNGVAEGVDEIADLKEKVALLKREVDRLERENRIRLGRVQVRGSIIELATELAEVSDESDLEGDAFEATNSALTELGLDRIYKTFTLSVSAVLRSTAEIEVEAESLEEAIQKVEDGECDDEIREQFDTHSADVDERSDVEEV